MDVGNGAESNLELVSNMQRAGVITTDKVANTFRVCSRDVFVPDAHKNEAFIDAPIRVDADDRTSLFSVLFLLKLINFSTTLSFRPNSFFSLTLFY